MANGHTTTRRREPPTIERATLGYLANGGMLSSSTHNTLRLVGIGLWLAVALGVVVVRFPETFDGANRTARANASLDLLDRALGGGNSVFPDQGLMVEARGQIPPGDTFRVALGDPQDGWSELTAPYAETFATSFLLPRRSDPDALWILCLACDREEFPAADVVWEGEAGLALLRGQP